jgi:hypothetical protein
MHNGRASQTKSEVWRKAFHLAEPADEARFPNVNRGFAGKKTSLANPVWASGREAGTHEPRHLRPDILESRTNFDLGTLIHEGNPPAGRGRARVWPDGTCRERNLIKSVLSSAFEERAVQSHKQNPPFLFDGRIW